MAIGYGHKTPSGMVFCFDALNPKCYSGTGVDFTDIVSGTTTSAYIHPSASLGISDDLGSQHLKFTPGPRTRAAYIPFPTTNINMPRGKVLSISLWCYFIDQGSIDHPFVGWETGSGWDGENGFVTGTGWGNDGIRTGVAGYNPGYSGMVNNQWIHVCVTYNGSATNGLKTYKNAIVTTQGTPTNTTIGDANTNTLNIGATNNRTGNFGGYMDIVQIWDRELSEKEVKYLYETQKRRFL